MGMDGGRCGEFDDIASIFMKILRRVKGLTSRDHRVKGLASRDHRVKGLASRDHRVKRLSLTRFPIRVSEVGTGAAGFPR